MISFIYIRSEIVLQWCGIAKSVIQIKHNKIRKDYEFKKDIWDRASWWHKLTKFEPSNSEVTMSQIKLDKDLGKIKSIETACKCSDNVYLTFSDLEFLKNRQKV